MSAVIEARRLNGTDLGKSLGPMGVIRSVQHSVQVFENKALGSEESVRVEVRLVVVVTDKGSFGLSPSEKITITGKPSPKPEATA